MEGVSRGSETTTIQRPDLPPLPPELQPLESIMPEGVAGQTVTQSSPPEPATANEQSSSAFVKERTATSQDNVLSTPKSSAKNSNFTPVLWAVLALAVIAAVVFFVSRLLGDTAIVSQLNEGECVENFFETAEDGTFVEIFSVSTVDCAQPHAYEVFTTNAALFPDDAFPGIEEAFATGQEFCLTEYEAFIDGDRENLSTWDVWTFVPPESSWEGDRNVQCLVGDFNQETLFEGTLRGAAGAQAG